MKRVAAMWGLGMALASSVQAFSVATDFEGASCRVLKVDEAAQSVEVMPGGDPQRGWPCWWCFRLDGCTPGKPVTVLLHGSDAPMPRDDKHQPLAAFWAMPPRAFVSTEGVRWETSEPGKMEGAVMHYAFTPSAASVRVAWGPAFTPKDAKTLVHGLAEAHPSFAQVEELCRSLEGRPVPMLHLKENSAADEQRAVVWIEARQHAWESGSSWVGQGCMRWIVSNATEAAWLRQHAEIFCIPIMDVDNTATGNGGKDALPQDHNRDWSATPHWNEVAAAQSHIRGFIQQQRMAVFLDLHNPGPTDSKAFFYVLPASQLQAPMVAARDRFVALATANIGKVYPMQTTPKFDGPGYHPLWHQMSGTWVSLNGNPETVGICLETAWNTPEAGTEGYQNVGAALAATVAEFLKTKGKGDSEAPALKR